MQEGHILCEKQSKNRPTQQPPTYSVAYPGAATTLINTFVEHIAIECTEHEEKVKKKIKMEQSTCIVPCTVYKPLQSAQAWITQFNLQGTPCLPLPLSLIHI